MTIHHDVTRWAERAVETDIRVLQTGQPLRILPHDTATKTARKFADHPEQDLCYLNESKSLLDIEGSDYAT